MSEQKQMWQLVKYELASASSRRVLSRILEIVLVIGVMAIIFEVFIYLVQQNQNENFSDIVFDILLLSFVLYYPQFMRGSFFRSANIKGDLYATPFYVYASQLPIKQRVLMRSRFVLSLLYTCGATVIAIVLAYVYPGTTHTLLTLGEFIVFLTIWGLLAAAGSGLFAAADVGGTYSKRVLWGYNILSLLVLVMVLAGLNVLTGHGFIGWTIELAKNAPLQGIAGTIVFALFCNWIWHLEARRYARKVDYHV